MRHFYRAEQVLPFPIQTVFDFFANPENLPRLMPAWQKARIDSASLVIPPPRAAPVSTGKVLAAAVAAGAGTRMTISFRAVPYLPLRLPWDAEITEFVWDDHFCDIQLSRGPFARWRHCHRLQATSTAGVAETLVLDEVEYELPFGPLGDLANAIFIRRQVKSTFDYRHERTAELMGRP